MGRGPRDLAAGGELTVDERSNPRSPPEPKYAPTAVAGEAGGPRYPNGMAAREVVATGFDCVVDRLRPGWVAR